ncbi:MAG: glycosyltransferase family 2 protein [Gammaproteobacteria bacterium]
MSAGEQTDVAVIVVGLNARDYVRESFASVVAAKWHDVTYELIYIDNGSHDGSAQAIRDEFPQASVIANEENVFYCPAANQGAAVANSRYYFFLNDDTIVYDDAIAVLVQYMDAHPEVGSAGSRLLNTDGTDQWSGRRFPSMWNAILGRRSILSRFMPNAKKLTDYLYRDEIALGEPFKADWVSAAAQLVSKETFEAVGGYAEDYYYWHEAVFCDRIRATGKEIVLHPQSKIMHYEGKGSGERPYKIRKWHIINFHYGAFRCYCEHYKLGRFNPMRLPVSIALASRAFVLLAATRLASFTESKPAE